MKRIGVTAVLLAVCMMGTTAYAAEEKKTASPHVQEVVLDGHRERMQCYHIDG